VWVWVWVWVWVLWIGMGMVWMWMLSMSDRVLGRPRQGAEVCGAQLSAACTVCVLRLC
jgi:hypothetical protein